MTDHELTLLEWVHALRATLPADLHPCGQCRMHEMLSEAFAAAAADDGEAVALCVRRIHERIAMERRFEHENRRAARAC